MVREFFRLKTFLFPRMAAPIYWMGLAVISLGTVWTVLFLFVIASRPPVVEMIAAGVAGLVATLAWRVAVEMVLALFSIRDLLEEIRDRNRAP